MLSLHDLLDHTTARIPCTKPVSNSWFYAVNGSVTGRLAKVNFNRLPESEVASDSHLFVTSIVSITLIDEITGTVVWHNPVPSSVRLSLTIFSLKELFESIVDC